VDTISRAIMNNTYGVLVWIHVYAEAVLSAFNEYADSVVHKVIVVFTTAGTLRIT